VQRLPTVTLWRLPRALPSAAARVINRLISVVRPRYLILVGLLGFLPQQCIPASHLGLLAHSHFELDNSLRTLAAGWFSASRIAPVTVVDIDEATQAGWRHPVTTPRNDLVRMINVVAAANPAAIVVDIDISWGGQAGPTDSASRSFRRYLQRYGGPAPLIFPKRFALGAEGFRNPVASSFDEVFRANSRLAWAHAEFVTGVGGAVRTWSEWVPVCSADGPAWLPSVETAVALHANPALGILPPVTPPALPLRCGSVEPVTSRLLLGPRITGPERIGSVGNAKAVSATVVLDPAIARDDSSLFTGRVVLIGATHADGGDEWLTPIGILPGVELLANTIRYVWLEPTDGLPAELARGLGAGALFLIFVAIVRGLKGAARPIVFVLVALGLTFGALKLGCFGFLDVLETAVLLTIVFEVIHMLIEFAADFSRGWHEFGASDHPPVRKHWWHRISGWVRRIRHGLARACLTSAEQLGAQ